MFRELQEWATKRQAEYMSHVRPEFLEWLNAHETVTHEQFAGFCDRLGMNSYERELLYPKLDNDALARLAEQFLNHCSYHRQTRPYAVYDDAMFGLIVPLLLERLRQKTTPDASKETTAA